VHINAEGNLFSVADNGRGHAVDRGVAGAPFLQFIYTQLGCPLDAVKGGPGSASRHRHVAAEPAVLCVVGHHTEVLQNAATDIPETYLKEDAGEKRNSKRSRTDLARRGASVPQPTPSELVRHAHSGHCLPFLLCQRASSGVALQLAV
jgi:hypothetical protein